MRLLLQSALLLWLTPLAIVLQAPEQMTFEPFVEITKELQFVEKADKKEMDCRCLWHDQARTRSSCHGGRCNARCCAHARDAALVCAYMRCML
jgi:hypothetical protein